VGKKGWRIKTNCIKDKGSDGNGNGNGGKKGGRGWVDGPKEQNCSTLLKTMLLKAYL